MQRPAAYKRPTAQGRTRRPAPAHTPDRCGCAGGRAGGCEAAVSETASVLHFFARRLMESIRKGLAARAPWRSKWLCISKTWNPSGRSAPVSCLEYAASLEAAPPLPLTPGSRKCRATRGYWWALAAS